MVELFNQTRTTHVTGRMMVVIITITRPGFTPEYQVKIIRNGADEAFVMVKESDRLMTQQEALELHDEWVADVKRHNRKWLKWQLRYAGHWTPLDEQMPDENMPVLVSHGSTWRLLSWMPDWETGEVLWFNSDDVQVEPEDFTPLFWTEGPPLPTLVDENARRLASGDYTLCPVCGEEPILWEELMRFGGCDKCTGEAEC